MKIFCMTCREHILSTTQEFRIGGPYHGAMFEPARKEYNWGRMFRRTPSTRRANLFCPRCETEFINHGKLLTEHGIVHPWQRSVDTSFSIVAPEGHSLPGRLMAIEDSRVGVDRVAIASMQHQEFINSFEDEAIDAAKMPTEHELTISIHEAELVDNGRKACGAMVECDDGHIECPKCGRPYRNTEKGRMWYNKHIESCGE